MGNCFPSRERSSVGMKGISSLSPEEKIIMQCENKHIFSKKNFKDMSKSIKSESTNGYLSAPQLKRALLDLEISLDDLTSPDSSTYHLLIKAKNEKNLYEVRKLNLICIFLGIGTLSDKCDWLFRQYDTDASLELDSTEFLVMVQEIFDVCSRILPILSVGEGVCSLTQEQYQNYSKMLLEGKPGAIDEVEREFKAVGFVNSEIFAKVFTENPCLSQLLNSTLVREMMRKHSTH